MNVHTLIKKCFIGFLFWPCDYDQALVKANIIWDELRDVNAWCRPEKKSIVFFSLAEIMEFSYLSFLRPKYVLGTFFSTESTEIGHLPIHLLLKSQI